MIKSLIAAAALLLSGCAATNTAVELSRQPVNQNAVATARDTSVALEAGYGTALVASLAWAKLPRCKPPQEPPACSTAVGVLAIERRRAAARAGLDSLNGGINNVSTSGSTLTALIASATAAVGGYQDVLAAYNGRK